MNLIGIRITPEFWGDKWTDLDTFLDKLYKLIGYDKIIKMLVAEETINKMGDRTHFHYHIDMEINENVEISKRKESLQKFIRREGVSGNRCYCVQTFADVNDYDRWFRYCLKEKCIRNIGFSNEWITENTLLSQDERKQTILRNKKTQEQLINKNQFRDKMFKHIDGLFVSEPEEVDIFEAVGMYYTNNGKTPPFGKLKDITLDYKVHRGWLSFRDYYYLHHG